MQAGSTFHELAHALPDEERRELYHRIMASLGFSAGQQEAESVVPASIHSEQRYEIIRREINDLGLWGRLRLWLRSWLTGKAKEDAHVDIRLLNLRRHLLRAQICPRASSTHLLSTQFAERLFTLFQAAAPVTSLFNDIWESREMLRTVVQSVLEERITNVKKQLNDFITDDEMTDIYVVSRSRTEIRNHLLERLDAYIDRIHDGVFAEIAAGITPLYYMKGIALFDYVGLLATFGYDAGEDPPEDPPEFKAVRATEVVDQLEDLYYACYTWQRLEGKTRIHRELLEYYLQAKHASYSDEPLSAEHISHQVQTLEQDIRSLNDAAAAFVKQVPLTDIIRYHRDDPYYRVVVYMPKVNLKEFYYSALRIELLQQIDARFDNVHHSAIEQLIEETFGHHPPDFPNFRSGGGSTVSKLGLPTFRHVRSLNILFNYIQIVYRRVIRQRLTVIHRAVSGRNRDLSNELSFYTGGLEDVADKIIAFDESFSPESEEGKTFYRIRYSVEKDVTQQRIYRSMVAQRERQSRALLDKGLEYLQGMLTVMQKLRTLQSDLKDETGEQGVSAYTLVERYASSVERAIRLIRLIMAQE